MSIYIDDALPVVKYNGLNVAHATVTLPATTTIGGSTVSALGVVTSSDANAVVVGPNGATNPVFNIDASTGSAAAGLNITGAVAAGTVAVATISSGANAGLSLDAKGAGLITIGGTSTGLVVLGKGSAKGPIKMSATTDYDAQAATLTIAGLLGGVVTQNSKTGASTATTPTGAEISAGISGVAAGYTFDCLYYNRGDQTSTITAGASGVTIIGTAAVATTLTAMLKFVCTGANTWVCYTVVTA